MLAFALMLSVAGITRAAEEPFTVRVDGSRAGRAFEGLGALSAGASSRLLIDYPEPQRSQLLDLLFKPRYGASFHHLKVEIGGGGNSTSGSEPSHAYTREEFEHPQPAFFQRGYEWWLMTEARRRNPDIFLDVLPWCAPGWIGEGRYYSPDMAGYVAAFLKGAREHHGLEIDFAGIWNETAYEAEWVKLLRQTLDRDGFERVRIVCCDQYPGHHMWSIADSIARDKELKAAVAVIGDHYPERMGESSYASSEATRQSGKPIWNAEGGPWSGDWKAFAYLARMYNRDYVEGRMTKAIIWSLITSYYDNLSLPGSGPLRANAPWCGYFEIQPAVWAIAHTTQFTAPGWQYLDSGCGYLPEKRGSYVTLREPGPQGDYSIIIETMDAETPQAVSFELSGGLKATGLAVWRSLADNDQETFIRQEDLVPREGRVTLTLQPKALYTLSTTRGQQKAQPQSPPLEPFPLPYRADFEDETVGRAPKYLSDQSGSFEVAGRPDGDGKCLRQLVRRPAIEWPGSTPRAMAYQSTVLGDTAWTDYQVQSEVYLEEPGFVTVLGRIGEMYRGKQPPRGYWLKVSTAGIWELFAEDRLLAMGQAAFPERTWHTLKLWMKGNEVRAYINGNQVYAHQEEKADQPPAFSHGIAGVGCSYNFVRFDNFAVMPVE